MRQVNVFYTTTRHTCARENESSIMYTKKKIQKLNLHFNGCPQFSSYSAGRVHNTRGLPSQSSGRDFMHIRRSLLYRRRPLQSTTALRERDREATFRGFFSSNSTNHNKNDVAQFRTSYYLWKRRFRKFGFFRSGLHFITRKFLFFHQ